MQLQEVKGERRVFIRTMSRVEAGRNMELYRIRYLKAYTTKPAVIGFGSEETALVFESWG